MQYRQAGSTPAADAGPDFNSPESGLSSRGLELRAAGGFASKAQAVLTDPFDAETNPHGFVNVGTAENVGLSRGRFVSDGQYVMCKENADFINKNVGCISTLERH